MSAIEAIPREPAVRQPLPRRDPLRTEMTVLLLLASVVMLSMGDGSDPDLWGHVRYGQDVLATGTLPRTATHTFTAVGHPWINHENGSEILFAFVANHAGGPGLMVLKDLLALLVVGLIVTTAARRGVGLLPIAIVIALVGWSVSPGWSVRPQLFTYTLFAVLIWLIDSCVHPEADAGRRVGRRIWFLPLLFAVWANMHGGFVAGLAIGALYLGGRAVELVVRYGRGAVPDVRRIAIALLLCAMAPLANPYGPGLIVWLVRDLAPPRPEIAEWHALTPTNPPAIVFLVLVAAAFAILFRAPRDVPRLVVLALAAWQALAHARHAPFFAILAGFWLPPGIEQLRHRLAPAIEPVERAERTSAPAALRRVRTVARVMAALMIAGMAFHSRALWVRKSTYPVDALDFMARNRLTGRLVVHFDWAQYALAAFAPETTVAFDGRFRTCYPQQIADMHFDFLIGDLPGYRWRDPSSPPVDDGRVLEYGDPDLVLIPRASSHAVRVVSTHPEWVLLYQDGLAQVWGRRDRYDDTTSPAYVSPAVRHIDDRPQSGWVAWPGLPPRRPATAS
jgi:hypothetical protein